MYAENMLEIFAWITGDAYRLMVQCFPRPRMSPLEALKQLQYKQVFSVYFLCEVPRCMTITCMYRKKENRRKSWAADKSDEQLVYVDVLPDVSDDVSDDVRYRQSASNNSAQSGRRHSEPVRQLQLSRKVLIVYIPSSLLWSSQIH